MGKKRRRRSHSISTGTRWGIGAVLGVLGVFAIVLSIAAFQNARSAQPVADYTPPAFTQRTPAPGPERFVVVGDSNTAVNSPDLAAGRIGDASWVSVLTSSGYQFAGGWAVGGTPSGTQAEGLAPVEGADLLLIMTGTNDLGQGVPFADTITHIDAMVAKAPAGRVVLLAIPPRDVETSPSSVEFNAALQQLASERGWEFFDGLGFLRDPAGGFVDGTSSDGIHLTREAQLQYGQIVADHLAAPQS